MVLFWQLMEGSLQGSSSGQQDAHPPQSAFSSALLPPAAHPPSVLPHSLQLVKLRKLNATSKNLLLSRVYRQTEDEGLGFFARVRERLDRCATQAALLRVLGSASYLLGRRWRLRLRRACMSMSNRDSTWHGCRTRRNRPWLLPLPLRRANVPEAAVEIRFKNLSVRGTQIIKAEDQGLLGKLKVGECKEDDNERGFSRNAAGCMEQSKRSRVAASSLSAGCYGMHTRCVSCKPWFTPLPPLIPGRRSTHWLPSSG